VGKSVFTLLQENPYLLNELPLGYQKWCDVRQQATRHNERTDDTSLWEESRPLEDDCFKENRESNR